MSAGICLMNKNGAVIAADSAVTIGNRLSIYNTADKIFKLSKNIPIGAVIYQNTDFMDVPMHLILKKFQQENVDNNKEKPGLEKYFDAFAEFLSTNKSEFEFEKHERNFIMRNISSWIEEYNKDRKKKIEILVETNKAEPKDDEIIEIDKGIIKVIIDQIDQKKSSSNNQHLTEYVNQNYLDDIKKYVQHQIKGMSEEIINEFSTKLVEYILKKDLDGLYTGFFLVGYGGKEIYPTGIHYKLFGFLDRYILYREIEKVSISVETPSKIFTLAQDDVMDLFLFGTSMDVYAKTAESISRRTEESLGKIDFKGVTRKKTKEIKEELSKVGTSVSRDLANYIYQKYRTPLDMSLSILPIDEMCQLAEEMINLTSLRRKIIIDNYSGTVGGPIDVAVISKFDKFLWKNVKEGHIYE